MTDRPPPRSEPAGVLAIATDACGGASIEERMARVKEIRNMLGELSRTWSVRGWTRATAPADQRMIYEQAETVGVRLLETLPLPADYWRNSEAELARTLDRIERDPEIQRAAHDWPILSREGQLAALQRAVTIMAQEQTRSHGVTVFPGTVIWVASAPFEGNSPANSRDPPETYTIELNASEAAGLTSQFARAMKCALHEQIHVKQSNYAHAYAEGSLPGRFRDAAQYLTLQPDAYTPYWLSQSMNRAQPCEREALMATTSSRSLMTAKPG